MKEYAAGIRSSELKLVDAPATPPGDAAAGTGAASSAGTEPVRASAAATADRFHAKATQEHATGNVDPSLWARAVAQAGGDEALATRLYLNSRATALRVEKRQEEAARRAGVVEALSNAPDTGFEKETSKAGPEMALKETRPSRRGSAIPNRRHMLVAAGVLGSLIVVAGLVALRSESRPAQQHNVAKPALPASVSGRSKPSGQTASVANSGGPASEAVASENFVNRIQELHKAGNWNVLVIYAAEWTRKQPGNADAWKELGLGYLKLRQYPDALDAATKAAQLAPRDYLVWQSLGQVYLALERPADALVAFQQAATLNDQDVFSLVQAGLLSTQLGRLQDASIAFAQALAVSPDNTEALCGAASIAQKQGRARDAEAMRNRAASLDGRCRDPSAGESVRVVAK